MKRLVLSALLVLFATTSFAGEPIDPCELLDDPATRGMMSGAFEVSLMERCGEFPVLESEGAGELVLMTIPNGNDVQVNDSSTDVPTDAVTQSECAVGVRPSDGMLVASWNDSFHNSHFPPGPQAFMGYGYSTDGGLTWTDLGGVEGAPVAKFRGDPDVAVDANDDFFLSGISSAGIIAVKYSEGVLDPAVSVHAGGSDDKCLMAIDNSGGVADGNIYVCWVDFAAPGFPIFCSTSTNGGASFGAAVNVCPTCGSESAQAPFPKVAPNGDLYVSWYYYNTWPPTQAQIKISRSTDQGASFTNLTSPTSTFDPSMDASATSSCFRPALNGGIRYADFPSMAIDPNGDIHVLYSHLGTGGDDADVFYTRSQDDGATWSAEVKLHDDSTTSDQFLPTIISNPNGILAAYWYDRREDASNLQFKIYGTRSLDGGATWTANEAISDVASTPWSGDETAYCYMGDYNKGDADEDFFYYIWSDNRNTVAGHPDPDVWLEARPVCDNLEAAVLFDPIAGKIPPSDQPITVSIELTGDDPDCPEDGMVYYTTDGSEPTTASDLYTGPIAVSGTTQIKALAISCCGQDLGTFAAGYTFCSNDDSLACGEFCLECGDEETCSEGSCVSVGDDDDNDNDASTGPDDDDTGDDDDDDNDDGCCGS
jgi:Chitobiase/beta-hexosaminidase C-terminal domain